MKINKDLLNLIIALFCAAVILGLVQDQFSR